MDVVSKQRVQLVILIISQCYMHGISNNYLIKNREDNA